MAGNPSIVVRIAANVREFLAGSEQVEDALDDLATESGDIARDVERDTDRMVDAFRDAGRKIDRATSDASRDVRSNLGDTGKEVGQEAIANVGEGIASGSADLTDTFLGTIGGLASVPVLAPFVLVGGLVAGAVIGGMKKEAERAKAAGAAAFSAYRDGIIEQSEKDDVLVEALGVEDLQSAIGEVRKQADELGVPFRDVFRYLQGERATPRLAAALESAAVDAEAVRRAYAQDKGIVGSTERTALAGKAIEDYWKRTRTAVQGATRDVEAYNNAVAKRPRTSGSSSGSTRPGGGQRTPTTRGQLP
jgi:hypothetical protein